jgi:hypothetical protein
LEWPIAAVVRWANWVFLAFGIGALAAVPEIQALVIVAALVALHPFRTEALL